MYVQRGRKPRPATKYGNHTVEKDGQKYDSVKEYRRFCELQLLQRAGEITELRRQVRYELIPAQRIEGKLVEQRCEYIADFVYKQRGAEIVEDTKGVRTKDYIIKRKLMLWVHGIRIKEV